MAFAGALLLALTAPAQAGDVYTWRTEDGATAFTDDPKSIPARYRSQVETRQVAALGSYDRYSRQDGAAAERYEQRLAERLERLRALNEGQGSAPSASSSQAAVPGYLTLRAGNRDADGVELSMPTGDSAGEEPIVVETVKMRLHGSAVTQDLQVVRRGDAIIAVRKPRPRQWNLSDRLNEADVLRRLGAE